VNFKPPLVLCQKTGKYTRANQEGRVFGRAPGLLITRQIPAWNSSIKNRAHCDAPYVAYLVKKIRFMFGCVGDYQTGLSITIPADGVRQPACT
jgi:hypothetical protein